MKQTLNYGLPLYEDNDPIDMRDGFNRAMIVIDRNLSRIDQTIKDLNNIVGEQNGD